MRALVADTSQRRSANLTHDSRKYSLSLDPQSTTTGQWSVAVVSATDIWKFLREVPQIPSRYRKERDYQNLCQQVRWSSYRVITKTMLESLVPAMDDANFCYCFVLLPDPSYELIDALNESSNRAQLGPSLSELILTVLRKVLEGGSAEEMQSRVRYLLSRLHPDKMDISRIRDYLRNLGGDHLLFTAGKSIDEAHVYFMGKQVAIVQLLSAVRKILSNSNHVAEIFALASQKPQQPHWLDRLKTMGATLVYYNDCIFTACTWILFLPYHLWKFIFHKEGTN